MKKITTFFASNAFHIRMIDDSCMYIYYKSAVKNGNYNVNMLPCICNCEKPILWYKKN